MWLSGSWACWSNFRVTTQKNLRKIEKEDFGPCTFAFIHYSNFGSEIKNKNKWYLIFLKTVVTNWMKSRKKSSCQHRQLGFSVKIAYLGNCCRHIYFQLRIRFSSLQFVTITKYLHTHHRAPTSHANVCKVLWNVSMSQMSSQLITNYISVIRLKRSHACHSNQPVR